MPITFELLASLFSQACLDEALDARIAEESDAIADTDDAAMSMAATPNLFSFLNFH